MKKLTIPFIICSLLLIGAIVYSAITYHKLTAKSVEVEMASEDMNIFGATVTAIIKQKDQTISVFETQVGEFETAEDELNNQVATLAAENSNLQSDKSILQSELRTATASYSRSQNDLLRLENSIMCKDKPKEINFSSNSTVSASLKDWLDKSNYKKATWEAIWSNSKTSTHTITEEYTHRFIVYFDEPNLGFKNAVFYIDEVCWLSK